MRQESRAYVWVTDLLGIPRNDSKDREGTQITVFGIEVYTSSFTTRLPPQKLEKAIKATAKVLAEQSVSFINIKSLVGFLSFCSQAVRLDCVFMRILWDLVNQYPRAATKVTRRRIAPWVREYLEWWNDLLATYNGVLFFDDSNRPTTSVYTDACLYVLGGFFFDGKGDWQTASVIQTRAFQAVISGKTLPPKRRMAKNPDDPSINVHEVEAIFLAFQLWSPTWHRHRVIVHTDSTTAFSGLHHSTLQGPANAPLRQTLLLAAKWDIVIEPRWVEGKKNCLADALSRLNDDKLITFSLSWQSPLHSMTRQPPTYPPHPAQQSSNTSHSMDSRTIQGKATTQLSSRSNPSSQ